MILMKCDDALLFLITCEVRLQMCPEPLFFKVSEPLGFKTLCFSMVLSFALHVRKSDHTLTGGAAT